MGEITVRTAQLADLETLLTFEQGIIAAERPFDPTLKDETISYYNVEAMITAPHVEVVIAEVDAEIIASGYARIDDAKVFLKHNKFGFLGFMYVKPAYRGRGVNKLVIQQLQRWCKKQGITECRLEVYDENEPAIKAYEKLGFKKLLITMRTAI